MRSRESIVALCLATLAWLPTAGAVELFGIGGKEDKDARLQVEFTGVEGPLLENVRALSSLPRLSTSRNLTPRWSAAWRTRARRGADGTAAFGY